MSDGQDSDESVEPNLAEFESIEYALEELRRRYDDEERRRVAVNAKANSLLALDAILISITNGLGSFNEIPVIVAITLLLLSGGITLLIVRSREYSRPLPEVGKVYANAQQPHRQFCGAFAEAYEDSIRNNHSINERKYSRFRIGFYTTSIAVLVLALDIALSAN